MKYLRFLWLGIFLLISDLQATHIVGGGFSYSRVQGNEYDFTLTLYFDAINGNPEALDQSALCHIFRKADDAYMEPIRLQLNNPSEYQYLSHSSPRCASLVNIQTRVLVYSARKILTDNNYNSQNGYYLIWERCCRNNIITNILSPEDAGQTFYMEFPPVTRGGQPFLNSSPRFLPITGDFPCINQTYSISFAATDVDGDKLVYSMANPLKGFASSADPKDINPVAQPYPIVDWVSGFSASSAIPGNPDLFVNQQTGQLSCRASLTGLFVFSVKCEEFRNGIKIGEVRREMQVQVVDCPLNDPPRVIMNNPEGKQISDDDTIFLKTGLREICLPVKLTDKQGATKLKYNVEVISAPGSLEARSEYLISFGNDSATALLCVPNCERTVTGEVWKIRLVAKDDGCSGGLSDTLTLNLIVQPEENLPQIQMYSTWGGGPDILMKEREKISFTISAEVSDSRQIYLYADGSVLYQNGCSFPFNPDGFGSVSGDFVFDPGCNVNPGEFQLRVIAGGASTCLLPDTLFYNFNLLSATDSLGIVPNLITLNYDGLNDGLSVRKIIPVKNCINEFDYIEIFNRWGKRILTDYNPDFEWHPDGLVEGQYYYCIHFKRQPPFTGWIQVVKDAR